MPFVRVKSARPGDPLHEFDVAVAEALRHPDAYSVIDPKPVAVARPASFIPGLVPQKTNPAANPRRGKKKPGEDSTAPAGANS